MPMGSRLRMAANYCKSRMAAYLQTVIDRPQFGRLPTDAGGTGVHSRGADPEPSVATGGLWEAQFATIIRDFASPQSFNPFR
jgi:hypothetical protein